MPTAHWKKSNPCRIMSMKLLRKLFAALQEMTLLSRQHPEYLPDALLALLDDEDVRNFMKSNAGRQANSWGSPRMTREDVLEMEAGPRLDKLVALHVMGWQLFPYVMMDFAGPGTTDGTELCPPDKPVHVSNIAEPPPYSADIKEAWQVLERMRPNADVGYLQNQCHCDYWPEGAGTGRIYAEADTAPLAICRAALLLHVPKGGEAHD
jgi:hypothetical protein